MTTEHTDLLTDVSGRLIHFFQRRGCGDQANDMAQDTILRVLSKKALDSCPLDERGRVVYGFAKKVYLEWCRGNRKVVALDPVKTDLADSRPLPEQAAIDSQQRQLLAICTGKLTPDQKSLLALYDDRDGSADQLAAELNISIEALRVRIFNIRDKLRKCIGKTRRPALLQIDSMTPRRAI